MYINGKDLKAIESLIEEAHTAFCLIVDCDEYDGDVFYRKTLDIVQSDTINSFYHKLNSTAIK